MVALLNKAVVEMQKRRDERYDAAKLKMDDLLEFTRLYKLADREKEMKVIINILKESTKTSGASVGDGGYVYFKYLDISKEDSESFIDSMIDMLSEVSETIVHKEIFDANKDLKSYLDFAPSHQLDMCIKSIDNVVGLIEISKYSKMENDLFEIKKDLTACINYNEKIVKEIEFEKAEV